MPGEESMIPPCPAIFVPVIVCFMKEINFSQFAGKTLNSAINFTNAPNPMAPNKNLEPPVPLRPVLWISAAATDSGKGKSLSSTITRRRSATNIMPSTPPTTRMRDAVR